MVLILNFLKMNCVAVIVWFVCGERMKAINTLKSVNKLAMLFNECTALPLTFESSTALNSTLLLYDMECSVINKSVFL